MTDAAITATLDASLLQAARLWIGHHRPYYAAALYRCPVVVTSRVPTVAVDTHWRIYVNPTFANNLSVTRLAAALIHEINHLIRDHSSRASGAGVVTDADRRRWNLASDAESNDDLHADGLDVDTSLWVFPWSFGFKKDLPAEIYYDQLRQKEHKERNKRNEHEANGCGSGSGGAPYDVELPVENTDFPGVSQREAQMVRADVANAVLERHRSIGDVPGDLVTWAQNTLNPKVDWRRVLAGMVREAVATVSDDGDITYRRFGRRSSALPHMRVPGLMRYVPQVAVVIDTSGSMDVHLLDMAVSEVRGILRSSSVADDAITVLSVDACVQDMGRVTRADNLRLRGRGGTDMTTGINAAIQLRPRPDIIVVLTDGFTPWPSERLRVPVIVGLIRDEGDADDLDGWRPPAWMRCVDIRG